MLKEGKREKVIAYIMKFSDELGDQFSGLGNDDLEHHLEGLTDRELVSAYKEIKENLAMSSLDEEYDDKIIDAKFIAMEMRELDKKYQINKNHFLSNIAVDKDFNDKPDHWYEKIKELEDQRNIDVNILLKKLKSIKGEVNQGVVESKKIKLTDLKIVVEQLKKECGIETITESKEKEIKYKGYTITQKFPSGMYEFRSEKQKRFLKFDDLGAAKKAVDKEGKITENKEGKITEDKDPCWKNYKQVGMKNKNGKQVPNCVPIGKSKGKA